MRIGTSSNVELEDPSSHKQASCDPIDDRHTGADNPSKHGEAAILIVQIARVVSAKLKNHSLVALFGHRLPRHSIRHRNRTAQIRNSEFVIDRG